MSYYIIYKTTNIKNKKFYIGMHKTKNLNDNYLGSGKKLKRSIRHYGKQFFKKEILFIFDNAKEMIDKEIEIVNENFIKRKDTYNISLGGEGAFGIDHITVKDKNGICFNVYKEDPRYLSGELKHHTKNTVTVKDKDENYFRVPLNDPRYISRELVFNLTGKVTVKDKEGKSLMVDKEDPRYLSGELIGYLKNRIVVKNKNGKFSIINPDDPRYLNGELKKASIWKGKHHTKKTREKISKIKKGTCIKEKNSQYGTCWITDGINNKKIFKGDLIPKGWRLGAVFMSLRKKRYKLQWISNRIETKMIKKENLIPKGWIKGRTLVTSEF